MRLKALQFLTVVLVALALVPVGAHLFFRAIGKQALRTQWENGHIVNAVLTFIALCALTATMLIDHRGGRQRLN